MPTSGLSADEVIAAFRAHSRNAVGFASVVCHPEPPTNTLGSRVGGEPYIEEGEEWPTDKAGRAMSFTLQLDFRGHENDLSFELPFQLLTLFCPENEFPFLTTDYVIRTYTNPGEHLSQAMDSSDWYEEDCWNEMTDPVAIDDIPDFEDLEFLSEQVGTAPMRIEDVHANYPTKIHEAFREELKKNPITKLGGFPHWLNGYNRPLCPICEQLMFQLVQIDQLAIEHHYLGAGGCGFAHLFFCPKHPSEFITHVSPLS